MKPMSVIRMEWKSWKIWKKLAERRGEGVGQTDGLNVGADVGCGEVIVIGGAAGPKSTKPGGADEDCPGGWIFHLLVDRWVRAPADSEKWGRVCGQWREQWNKNMGVSGQGLLHRLGP